MPRLERPGWTISVTNDGWLHASRKGTLTSSQAAAGIRTEIVAATRNELLASMIASDVRATWHEQPWPEDGPTQP